MGQSGSGVPPLNLERNRAGTALPLFLCVLYTAIRQSHSFSRRFGKGILGRGTTQDIGLSRFPCPIFHCPFSPYQKQDGRQKNGGKKISSSYIFASIFLPFSVRLAIRSRSSLMFGCGSSRWVPLRPFSIPFLARIVAARVHFAVRSTIGQRLEKVAHFRLDLLR
jgi:hypothetical protein